MTIPAHILRASLDDALEVVALTEDRAQALVARCVRAITQPQPDVDELADCLRACCVYNDAVRDAGRRLAGTLDELARLAHRGRHQTVKELADELRPHLAVIARPPDDEAYVAAVHALQDLIDASPVDRLAGGGMQGALGPGRHALLMAFVEGYAEPFLTQHTARDECPIAGRAGGGACCSTVPPEAAGSTTTLEVAA